jgi:uncharacterized membrane protein (DUF106 family)
MTLYAWCIRATVFAAVSVCMQLAHAAAACEKLEGCAAKACRIDAQIEEAKVAGKNKALPSLERERAEIAHCSDDGLRQKRKVALDQAQHRIDLRQDDLKKAQAKGDPAQIKKAQKNLDSAQHAYDEIKNSPL